LNDIFYKRLCKLIAITWALSEDVVWQVFTEVQSIDKVIDMAQKGEIQSQ
jgi:hypothetical protein